jgi:hypothetical protein
MKRLISVDILRAVAILLIVHGAGAFRTEPFLPQARDGHPLRFRRNLGGTSGPHLPQERRKRVVRLTFRLFCSGQEHAVHKKATKTATATHPQPRTFGELL